MNQKDIKRLSFTNLKLSNLPQRLFLASVSKDQLDICIKVILKLAFFWNETRKDGPSSEAPFFSYTDTADEISFILDEKSLAEFENSIGGSNPLIIGPGCWKAIQVYEGADALSQTGYIATLSEPLKHSDIEMIYLSTYNTDLILVKERSFEEAFSLLNKTINNHEEKETTHSRTLSSPKSWAEVVKSGTIFVTILPEILAIATYRNVNLIEISTQALLRQFFFPPRENRFFSFTASPAETTMILEQNQLASFPKDVLEVHSARWKALQVAEGLSGSAGINLLANALAVANISIYYLSTFNSDFILVPEHKAEEAMLCLNQLDIITEQQ